MGRVNYFDDALLLFLELDSCSQHALSFHLTELSFSSSSQES